jgi:hypothetical protein
MLEHCCRALLPFSHKSISEVGHWATHTHNFTGTKGPSPNHEEQPQAIIRPNFTIGTMHSDRWRSPGNRRTQIHLSDCQIVKRDSSLQRRCFHCSRVQWQRALHHSSRRLALGMVMLGLYAAAQPWKPISRSSR